MMGYKQHVSAKVIEQGDNHAEHSDTSSALIM